MSNLGAFRKERQEPVVKQTVSREICLTDRVADVRLGMPKTQAEPGIRPKTQAELEIRKTPDAEVGALQRSWIVPG